MSYFRRRNSGSGGRRREPPPPRINEAAVNAIFDRFKSEDDPETMDFDGIAELGEAMGIDPAADLSILVLAWLTEAATPMMITRGEFLKGMQKLECDRVEDLQPKLAAADPRLLDHRGFRSFYRFVFMFQREGRRKTIEKDLVKAMLEQVLSSAHLPQFLEFLDVSKEDQITIDQWNSFYEFQAKIDVDMGNFDEADAWPVLLDEYAEWVKGGKAAPQS